MNLGDAASVLAGLGTFALAIITVALARKTAAMADATREMVVATREAIAAEDARLERALDHQNSARRRERSIDAAVAMLDGIETAGIEPGDLDPDLVVERGRLLRQRLWSRVDLIDNPDVRSRVQVCLMMLQYLRWSPEALARDRLSLADVVGLVPEVIQATELTIQAYIGEQSLPDWHDRPRSASHPAVADWIDSRTAPRPAHGS